MEVSSGKNRKKRVTARDLGRILIPVFFALVIFMFCGMLFGGYLSGTAQTSVAQVFILLFAGWMFARDLSGETAAGEGMLFSWKIPFAEVFLAAGIGVCSCFALNAALTLSGLAAILAEDYESVNSVLYESSSLFPTVLTSVILAPLSEELLFRGICYRRMRTECSFSVAFSVIFSAVLFGIYHGNAAQALYGGALGVLLALLYEMTGSIAAPVIMHAFANLFSMLLSVYDGLNAAFTGTFLRFICFTVFFCLADIVCFVLLHRRKSRKERNS